jgi:hypothetical protein
MNFKKLPAKNKNPNWLLYLSLIKNKNPKIPIAKATLVKYAKIIISLNNGSPEK